MHSTVCVCVRIVLYWTYNILLFSDGSFYEISFLAIILFGIVYVLVI